MSRPFFGGFLSRQVLPRESTRRIVERDSPDHFGITYPEVAVVCGGRMELADPNTGGDPAACFDIERARAETAGCGGVIHLNNAGSALMPRPVLSRVMRHLELEAHVGGYEAAELAVADVRRIYESAATLLGCLPSEIALTENASRAWQLAVQSVPLSPGDRVVIGVAEYVSNKLVLDAVSTTTGAEVVVVPDDEHGRFDVEFLRTVLDERTKLVAVTHVPVYGGPVNPVHEVGRLLRDAPVLYLVDACQTVGQLRVDVSDIGCDLLTTAGRKYLRGPRGTGLLYARSSSMSALRNVCLDTRGLRWFGNGEVGVRRDAKLFEAWEASFATRLGLGAAIDYALSWGIDAIWQRIRSLSARLTERLGYVPGVLLPDSGVEGCGLVRFRLPGNDPHRIRRELRRAGINVSVSERELAPLAPTQREETAQLRASVHYYNTEDEIDRFGDVLELLLKNNA